MINDNCSGFSLLELLAVAAILAFAAAVATPVFSNKADQTRFQRTAESMAEIEKALLGLVSHRVKGDVRFAGYVQDMGGLPDLYDVLGTPDDPSDDQPNGLWTCGNKGDLDGDGEIDLTFSETYSYEKLESIRIGWRGPYLKLKTSPEGCLMDGWRNPFIFEIIDGDFVITSLSADGEKGGEGYNRDIAHTIKRSSYLSTVSGYVSPQMVNLEKYGGAKVSVRIYYRPGPVKYMETTAKPDGYFHFDGVPIGTQRMMKVMQNADTRGGYKIAVEPEAMWLGHLGLAH